MMTSVPVVGQIIHENAADTGVTTEVIMSAAALSNHIPDLNLITYYAEKQQSFLSRFSPWTKFAFLIIIVLLVTLTGNLTILAVLYLVILIAYAAAHLPLKKLFGWYTMPVIFVISLVGIMAWSEPGNPIISFTVAGFPVTLTDNGILLVVTLLLKALIVVTYSLLFLMTTQYKYFSAIIYRVFPSPLDQIFLMTYRFLFLTLAMMGSILNAVRSRGGGLIRSIFIQGRMFADVFALVFIRSFERSERVHKAMIARGFSGSYGTVTMIPSLRITEYLLICAGVAVVLAVAFTTPSFGG
jgi:cobalt/nickel transport system permease protein